VAFDPYLLQFEADETRRVIAVTIERCVEQYKHLLPTLTHHDSDHSSLTYPDNPVHTDILSILQYLESVGSFWCGIKLGAAVRRLREKAGMTRHDLAARSDLKETIVAALEEAESEPSEGAIDQLADSLSDVGATRNWFRRLSQTCRGRLLHDEKYYRELPGRYARTAMGYAAKWGAFLCAIVLTGSGGKVLLGIMGPSDLNPPDPSNWTTWTANCGRWTRRGGTASRVTKSVGSGSGCRLEAAAISSSELGIGRTVQTHQRSNHALHPTPAGAIMSGRG
jgi:transcriptional regulator with XRE-family HTH domain